MRAEKGSEEGSMTDALIIKDLLVRTVIGVSEEERRDRQDVLISVALETDTSRPGKTDDIADAVNYRTVTKRILALAEGSAYHLVERFAEEIAALCLEEPCVTGVRVTVEKPGALRFARSVCVTIERGRPGG
ncbi:MAG: dihydroneopterin aldolase [Anaerolineales bacterium]|nr:dihydroneopterin aldolase [Anaerolineales bacterium]